MKDAVDRALHEHGLVEQELDVHRRRRRLLDLGQSRFDAIDDVECRGVAVLDDGDEDRSLAFRAHYVLLHRPAVAHMRHVGQKDGGAAGLFDRNPVQRINGRRCIVDLHDELLVAQLRVPRGQGQALGVDGGENVGRRNAASPHRIGIEIDHDLAVFAAIGGRQCDARDRRQGLTHPIDAVIVKLLLVKLFRTQA